MKEGHHESGKSSVPHYGEGVCTFQVKNDEHVFNNFRSDPAI